MNSKILFLDVETTTHNKGHPFDPRNFLVSYAAFSGADICFRYYRDPDFVSNLRDKLCTVDVVVGFNIKFDLHWINNLLGEVPQHLKVWDCQLAEFIYSGQQLPYDSLNAALERYGLPTKLDVVKEYWDAGVPTEDIPIAILQEYNEWDVYATKLLFDVQQTLLSDKQKTLVYLEGEDLKALQAAEYAGIKFDIDKATEKVSTYKAAIADIECSLNNLLPDGIPEGCFNWDSGDHLSVFLYGGEFTFEYPVPEEAVYKSGDKKGQAYTRNRWMAKKVLFPQQFIPLEGTLVKKCQAPGYSGTAFYQTDAPTLAQLKAKNMQAKQTLELLFERSDKTKVVEMITSIFDKMAEKNWQNNYIHGQFNQNVVVTGRLSSSQPNLQNTPPEVDQLLISRYDN